MSSRMHWVGANCSTSLFGLVLFRCAAIQGDRSLPPHTPNGSRAVTA